MNEQPTKKKYPRAEALAVAKFICDLLKPECERIICAGSLRRRKQLVGDVEIVYVPKFVESAKTDMFAAPPLANCAEARIDWMLDGTSGPVLKKRLNSRGYEAWGPKNKLAVHAATLIPVDLFASTAEGWWSYVVCRTGSKENNTSLASAFLRKGWHWEPYKGFRDREGNEVLAKSEREVFELAGLPYKEPWER